MSVDGHWEKERGERKFGFPIDESSRLEYNKAHDIKHVF